MIQNNKLVIYALHKLKDLKTITSFSTYDFSKSYTNIPHDKLIKTLNSAKDFAFKGRNQHKMSVNNYGIPIWLKSFIYFVFDINSLKRIVEYLVRNCYFDIRDKVFQQIIDIPVRSDIAPFFTNLFLLY